MNFNQTLNNYLSELHQEVLASQSGETTAELSFRTSLDNFFKNIAREIDSKIVTIPGLCRRFGHLRLLIDGSPELLSSKALSHKGYGFLGTTLA
jgi:hypothetical protein